jgi:hypothetical protein
MHALVGEGEGEADAAGAGAADAHVAGAGMGGAGVAVADAARAVCAPAAGATGMTITAAADGTDATRGTSAMGGIMHVDAPRPQNGAGAVATGAQDATADRALRGLPNTTWQLWKSARVSSFDVRCSCWRSRIAITRGNGARSLSFFSLPDARRRVRSLSLLSLPRALCARSDQTVETVDWTKSWPPSP